MCIIQRSLLLSRKKDYTMIERYGVMFLNWLQKKIACFGGDIWFSNKMLALFPYPAILYGHDETKIVGSDYRMFSTAIQPGDFFLTTQSRYKISNAAIKGTFRHLMVYTGPIKGTYDKETRQILKPRSVSTSYKDLENTFSSNTFVRTVTHATSEGVGTYDLLDIFFHYDYICAIRCWENDIQQQKIIQAALSQVGLDYNFDFESEGDPALYCTELGAYCLEKAGIAPPEQAQQMTKFWKPWKKSSVYLSDYFVSAFPIVCTTASCNEPKLSKQSPVADIIRKKLLHAPDYTNS